MTEISYIAIGPVIALTLGVVTILLVEVSFKPSSSWLIPRKFWPRQSVFQTEGAMRRSPQTFQVRSTADPLA